MIIALVLVAVMLRDPDTRPVDSDQRADAPVGTAATSAVVKGAVLTPVGRSRATAARGELGKIRARAARIAAREEASQEPISIRIGTFNILGSQHTGPGGDKGPGWPGAAARMPGTLERIRAHGVSVFGVQEAQPDQIAALLNGTGFTAFPGNDTDWLDRVNSIFFDPARYDFVSGQTFEMSNGVGYREQPIVRLREKTTGREFYVINAHPPAGGSAALTAKRAASQARLLAVINQLKSDGLPILVTGDMNDREAFAARVVGPGGLISARTSGPIPVDWIVGTPDVSFSDYLRDTTSIARRLSDHFFISATATIGATG